MSAEPTGLSVLGPPDVASRWPRRRIAAWVLIGLGVLAFVVAGDVRTNWVIGDIGPDLGEVALPRLGTIALMAGLALLALHQVRARRTLPADRYRGPSVLVLLALITGLSVLLLLPVRSSINLALEGGVPDLTTVVMWMLATHIAALLVTWMVLRSKPMPGLRLFADSRAVRHVLIGIGVGIPTQICAVGAIALVTGGMDEPMLQAPAGPLVGLFAPGVPLWLGAVSSVAAAPLAEELFFRGLVLHAWLREYGVRAALIGSSALFGLVHFGLYPLDGFVAELPRLTILAAGGLVLGILAVRTGSLIAPIAAHATMNALTILLALALIGPLGPA